jgi:16S rRNA (guanine527-N7)-methyltransferase
MTPPAGDAAGTGTPAWVRAAAGTLFGERLPTAEEYAWMLATDGVLRGLVGPREAPRIWERHLLNCAVTAELVPPEARVTDVGSGAGLPGLVLALARPDLTVVLVETKQRATAFLTEAVTGLGLTDRVEVVRARAEECAGRLPSAEVVTARALAPLDRLAAWCLPLARVGGRVLALKGESAAAEVASHAAAIRRLGGGPPTIRHCGTDLLAQPTTVVEIPRLGGPTRRTRRRG